MKSIKSTTSNFAIVVSKTNEPITKQLLEGARDTLKKAGLSEESISIFWVPGAFEIPLITKILATDHTYHAIICLGAIIKGETDHYTYLSHACTSSILQISLETKIPISLGVLTVETVEQAIMRTGIKIPNKGSEAAQTALEMSSIVHSLEQNRPSSKIE